MGSALHKDGHKDGHHQMSFNKKGRGEEEEEEKRPLRTHMKVLILGAPEVGKHSICEILSRNSDFGKWHHQDRERDSFFTSRMIGETEYSLELVLPPHEQKEDELVLVRPNGDPEAEKEWVTKMRERTKRRATQKKELYWKMAEARGYLIVYSATDPPSLKRLLGYVVTIVRVTGERQQDLPLAVIGNKHDLPSIKVSQAEGQSQTRGIPARHFIASTLDSEKPELVENLEKALMHVVRSYFNRSPLDLGMTTGVNVNVKKARLKDLFPFFSFSFSSSSEEEKIFWLCERLFLQW